MPEAINPVYFNTKWNPKKFRILFVGTLIKRKGIEILIEAVEQNILAYPNIELILIGGGRKKYISMLKTKIRKLGII